MAQGDLKILVGVKTYHEQTQMRKSDSFDGNWKIFPKAMQSVL